jgi:hypothetical protein
MLTMDEKLRCLEAAVSHVNGLLASGARPSKHPMDVVLETAAKFEKFIDESFEV